MLIECRLRRNEMDIARAHAEELFNAEIESELLKRTKRLKACNSILLRSIGVLICAMVLCAGCAVLNIEPSFSLVAEFLLILSIITLTVIGRLITGRFEKAAEMIMERYDREKQLFIGRVFSDFMGRSSS